jgi:outer membrane lipoprotein-sorting protein
VEAILGEQMKRLFLSVGIIGCVTLSADGQPTSGKGILLMVEEKTFARIEDFVVMIEAEVKMERLRMPNVQGTLYYKKPDKLNLESKNFAMIPREGVVLNPAVLADQYDVTLVGWDTVGEARTHKLQLAARDEKTRLRQLFVWVDPELWTISKMETVAGEGRTVTMVYEYDHVESILLPKSVQVTIASLRQEPPDRMAEVEPELSPRPDRVRQAIQAGTINIRFRNYRLNVGLTDEQFERKAKE